MTTPNFDDNSSDGLNRTESPGNSQAGGQSGSDFGRTGQEGGSGSAGRGSLDDVSLNRAGQNKSSGMDGMMNSAEDAIGQLQSKASELTSRLIDNIDVDDLTQKLEAQVREHPTRTLMVALGAGFLLGRAVKK